MKNTEIIAISPMNLATKTFKDDRLTKATQRIANIYSDAAKYAETKNREISKILAEVADKKSYEKDGFKSVADYANTVFGIARQNAYALANAGKVYNDPNAHKTLQAMSPSKLSELSTVDKETLNKALDSGTINANTTQKDLREFAMSAKSSEPAKAEIVDTYTASPIFQGATEEDLDTWSQPRTLTEWDDYFQEYISSISPDGHIEIIKLPKGKIDPNTKKPSINRTLYLNKGASLVVNFRKYTAPKAAKTQKIAPATKYTREELLAMLKAMDEAGTLESESTAD